MAENQNKIFIHISSTNEGSGVNANQNITTGNNINKTTSKKPKQAGEKDENDYIVATMLVNEGKKIMSAAISNYANITGNSITANRLNAFSTIASYGLSLYAGGWVGAIYVATDIAIKEATKLINTSKTNAQIELMRQRVGYSNLNGSRGTNG